MQIEAFGNVQEYHQRFNHILNKYLDIKYKQKREQMMIEQRYAIHQRAMHGDINDNDSTRCGDQTLDLKRQPSTVGALEPNPKTLQTIKNVL
jgi:hypothetical protein